MINSLIQLRKRIAKNVHKINIKNTKNKRSFKILKLNKTKKKKIYNNCDGGALTVPIWWTPCVQQPIKAKVNESSMYIFLQ